MGDAVVLRTGSGTDRIDAGAHHVHAVAGRPHFAPAEADTEAMQMHLNEISKQVFAAATM